MLEHIRKLYWLFDRRDKLKIIGLFFLMMIASIIDAISVSAIPALVAILADGEAVLEDERFLRVWELAGVEEPTDLIVFGSIFLVTAFLLKNGYLAFYKYISTVFIFKKYAQLGDRLFARYMDAPYSYHLNRNSAQLLRNVTQETQLLVLNFLFPMLKLLLHLSVIIMVTVLLLIFVDFMITGIILVVLGGGSLLFMRVLKKHIKKYGREEQDYRSLMIQSVNEGIGGLKDAKVSGRTGFFRNRFRASIRKTTKASGFREFIEQLTIPMVETIAVVGVLFIALLMVWQGQTLQAIIPALTMLAAATARLMPAFRIVVQHYTKIRYYSYVVDPVYDDLQEISRLNRSEQSPGDEKKLPHNKAITFNNVRYRYPESDEYAIDGISLTIKKGEAVAFVGPSGAGKTTIVDLLLGLLQPQDGSIEVDGMDIREHRFGWQQNVGYIPQFIYLSDTTIRGNIAFGLPEGQIREELLWDALRAAQLESFIEQLPDGLDTIIGERGVRLSGGQRQRIGIARALYHNPEVLVMDEATSALDNQTERLVVSAIEGLRGDRTLITIAHRLTTVRNSDRLFYLEDGILCDSGTYNELEERLPQFRLMTTVEPAAEQSGRK
ncbi:MAG: ABC transporter ATP-binding protein [Balneolaceae bacterium]